MLHKRYRSLFGYILMLCLILSAVVFSACDRKSEPSDESLQMYVEARELFRSGESDDSIQILKKITQEEGKKFPQAQLLLGRILYLQNDHQNAGTLFKELYTRDSGYHEAGLWLLKTYITNGNINDANDLAEKLLSRSPEDPRVLYQKARLLSMEEDYANALDYFAAAADYSEEIALAHLRRGEIYKKLGNQDKALIELSKAVSTVPSNSPMAKPIISLYRELKSRTENE